MLVMRNARIHGDRPKNLYKQMADFKYQSLPGLQPMLIDQGGIITR